jgi:hypothetical protein
MSFQITITITATTVTGPFNLYECTSVDGASCSGTALATGVSRDNLLTGVTYTVSDTTKVIKMSSTGTCEGTDRFLTIQNIPNATYYYYALGDCTDLRYSGLEVTKFPFGPQLIVPVCMTEAQVALWYETYDPGTQDLVMDYSNPCAFGEEYVSSAIGRSSAQITEGTVYSIGDNCWSVIETTPTESWTVNLDGVSPFDGTCYDCIYGPFTGFTYSGYTVTVCGTGVQTVGYVNNLSAPVVTTGAIYPVVEYDQNGNVLGSYCATWGNMIGGYDGPLVAGVHGGILVPPGINMNGSSVADCNSCDLYYRIGASRCDGIIDEFNTPIWTDNDDVAVGDVITTDLNDNICRIVTSKTTFKATPFYFEYVQTGPIYMDGYFSGANACADCITAGGSGGGEGVAGNVVSVGVDIGQATILNETCADVQSTPYNAYEYQVTFTFNGTSGPVTPDTTVEYSVNGTTWTTWTPTGSTFVYTMYYKDRTPCSGGVVEIDNMKIKVNNIVILNYDILD